MVSVTHDNEEKYLSYCHFGKIIPENGGDCLGSIYRKLLTLPHSINELI